MLNYSFENGMKIWDINWTAKTAGPSPHNNERTELFLLGCEKAMSGNPCKGCFNQKTWDASKAIFTHDPKEVAAHINKHAPNKYITIGGGEPTDQIDNLLVLCEELKKYNFHIFVYTWRSLLSVLNSSTSFRDKMIKLIKLVDIIVDGEYVEKERLYKDNANDGTFNSIGSGNQIVWSKQDNDLIGYRLDDIKNLRLDGVLLSYSLVDSATMLKISAKELE